MLSPPLPELRHGRHACRRPPTLPLAHYAVSSNLKHVLSYKCSSSSTPAPTISRPFLFPDPAPYWTSAAATARRRQPPPLRPSPDPVLLEHRRDPLVFPSPSNFILPCSNIISRSAGKLQPTAARPRRRPNATLSLNPNQGYQQHYITPHKRSSYSFTALRHPSQQNAVPPSPPVKARGPPHRRQHPSAPTPAKLGTAIASPHPHGAHARLICSRSLAPRRE
jgi:hypothetical protein